MNKILKNTLTGALSLCLLAGCGLSGTGWTQASAADDAAAVIDISVSDRDASGEYDAADAVTLSPGDDLTITEAGVYVLSGVYENQMVVIDADEEAKVQLVLDNATLTNESGPAVYVRCADKVFITAAAGTVNSISDGADYTLADDETTLDAAIFSREDLTINGAGSLTVTGNFKHAVVSKDDLVITAKDLTVSAVNVGLNGKDSVTLSEAAVRVTAGTDGVRSENAEDEGKGYVALVSSALTVESGKDGIQAATVFTADASTVTVSAGGSDSTGKGIKAGSSVTVSSGVYQISAMDDAVHTDGSALILGGEFTITSRDDGIHANEKAEISGGTLNITAYEGIEATGILISGGEFSMQASDDGINAGWKSSAYSPTVEISGGTLNITMAAGDTDAIDSNGSLIISGGTINISASSPFDYDGSASFTGGTVTVNGQQVTTLTNQMMGGMGGPGGMGNMGGMGDFGGGPGGMGNMGGPGGRH